MLSDTDLAAYLDGALGAEALGKFEEIAAEDDGAMAEIVAQLRIHRLVQLHADGPNSEAVLKDAILDAALGRGLRDAAAGSASRSDGDESEPGIVFAAICFMGMVILAICLWYCAPR